MARMVPFPMLPTESSAERRLYERFFTQLSDEYVVYHSVDWVLGARKPGEAVIQGEADFIVAHPVDGVLVLEAKGGELEYDPATRRWTQSGRSGRHHLDEDPYHQARDEMHSLIEILSHQPGWGRWRPSYGYGVAFPDGLMERDAHPGARADWAFDREDRKIVELTDDQAYVLSYVTKLHRATIVGPAGSGKTMLALAIASRLAGGGNDTLLTCFNWRLAEYLKENIGEAPHAQALHFHELCRQVAGQAGLTVPDEPTEDAAARDHFERVLPDLLEEGARILGPRYDAMVVDEAQDFLPAWWPKLLALHRKPEDGYLFLFADDNQNLYGRGAPEGLADLTLPLPANLRNTKPIHEFVSVFYGGDSKPATHGPAGPPVEILGYKDDDDLAHLLALGLKNLEGG